MGRFNGFLRRKSAKKEFDVTVEPVAESNMKGQCRQWKPISLRRPFLFAVILVTLGLLALVQFLVVYDQQNDGILFAPKISELGAGHVFLYRYFPTILSVSYGIIWHWIDVDTRRIEPYRQLSKPGGASARNSLLLRYPTDLLAFVPLKALKRKHWSVVISSSILVLVGMGLTPLQAAMFATETVTKSSAEPMQQSMQHMSIAEQAERVSANYTYSVANIVWLEERLPRFMTREAALAPFDLVQSSDAQDQEYWTAPTTLYGVDVHCEDAVLNRTEIKDTWASTQGCQVRAPFGPEGKDVVGDVDPTDLSEVKDFTPFFAGSQNHDGLADYYIGPYCPENVTNVLMLAFAKNRESENDDPGPVTRLFCETSYYEQDVTATVRRINGEILDISDYGPKRPLSSGMFNTSLLEWQINSATQQNYVRSAIPSLKWPDQTPQLAKLPISFPASYIKMTSMVGMMMGSYPMPTVDYMNPQVLGAAYQAAHRLLFARAMVDVLADDSEIVASVDGSRTYRTQAVRIVPRFAYAVESVLGIAAIMTSILMFLSWGSFLNLLSDPDSMSALMVLVKSQTGILEQYAPHGQSSWKRLKADTCESAYALVLSHNSRQCTLELLNTYPKASNKAYGPEEKSLEYPLEFSLPTGIIFTLGLVASLIAAVYLYQTGQHSGLSLPSQNVFVRQMLENYIPTIIATLIEPVWVVLNRLLCYLRPFEELRSTEASAHRSIGLSYSSLPPQFTLFKALKARHFVLASVCAMALLANVLAVAFGGMFSEETLSAATSIESTPLYQTRFRSSLENATMQGAHPFYAAMANFTSNSPMPPWTDDAAFYMPVSLPAGLNGSDYLKIDNVPSFQVAMDCEPLGNRQDYTWNFTTNTFVGDFRPAANLSVSMLSPDDDLLSCAATVYTGTAKNSMPCLDHTLALELLAPLDEDQNSEIPAGDLCQQYIGGLWARRPARSMCGNESFSLSSDDAMAMACRPSVSTQLVNITVTGEGIVREVNRADNQTSSTDDDRELIKEATRAFFARIGSGSVFSYDDIDGVWHNDTFPSSWHTYVMNNIDPDNDFLDWESPVPEFEETSRLFEKAYKKTFAIWMGINYEALLMPADGAEASLASTLTRPEVRITVSRAMMILSSTILALYIVVAVAVYAHRPGNFLPRMPLTMASDIAMFAGSTVVRDIEDTTAVSGRELSAWLGARRVRFGYGTFVGADGRPHVGVERAPFVVPLP